MTRPRTLLVAVATACSWSALAVSVLAAGGGGGIAVVVGAVSLLAWHRHGGWAATAAPVGCVVLLAGSTPGGGAALLAGLAGVLALMHLVLADLASDVAPATRRVDPVVAALRPMLPGVAVAAAGTAVVAGSCLLGGAVPLGWPVVGVLLGSPLLLLTAALLGLGMQSRRRAWESQARSAQLSDLTKRYLARAGLRV